MFPPGNKPDAKKMLAAAMRSASPKIKPQGKLRNLAYLIKVPLALRLLNSKTSLLPRVLPFSAAGAHRYPGAACSKICSSWCTCRAENAASSWLGKSRLDRPFRNIEDLAHASQLETLEMFQVKNDALARRGLLQSPQDLRIQLLA
jgi:hypothetical protein